MPDSAQLKAAKKERREAISRKRKVQAVLFKNRKWQVTPSSQRFIFGAAIQARECLDSNDTWPADFMGIPTNNNQYRLTAQDVIDLALVFSKAIYAQHLYARNLKDRIDEAQTVEAVNAIEIDSGWPHDTY